MEGSEERELGIETQGDASRSHEWERGERCSVPRWNQRSIYLKVRMLG